MNAALEEAAAIKRRKAIWVDPSRAVFVRSRNPGAPPTDEELREAMSLVGVTLVTVFRKGKIFFCELDAPTLEDRQAQVDRLKNPPLRIRGYVADVDVYVRKPRRSATSSPKRISNAITGFLRQQPSKTCQYDEICQALLEHEDIDAESVAHFLDGLQSNPTWSDNAVCLDTGDDPSDHAHWSFRLKVEPPPLSSKTPPDVKFGVIVTIVHDVIAQLPERRILFNSILGRLGNSGRMGFGVDRSLLQAFKLFMDDHDVIGSLWLQKPIDVSNPHNTKNSWFFTLLEDGGPPNDDVATPLPLSIALPLAPQPQHLRMSPLLYSTTARSAALASTNNGLMSSPQRHLGSPRVIGDIWGQKPLSPHPWHDDGIPPSNSSSAGSTPRADIFAGDIAWPCTAMCSVQDVALARATLAARSVVAITCHGTRDSFGATPRLVCVAMASDDRGETGRVWLFDLAHAMPGDTGALHILRATEQCLADVLASRRTVKIVFDAQNALPALIHYILPNATEAMSEIYDPVVAHRALQHCRATQSSPRAPATLEAVLRASGMDVPPLLAVKASLSPRVWHDRDLADAHIRYAAATTIPLFRLKRAQSAAFENAVRRWSTFVVHSATYSTLPEQPDLIAHAISKE